MVKYFGEVKKEYARKEILQKEAQNISDGCGKKMSPAAWIALGKKQDLISGVPSRSLKNSISFVGEKNLIDKDDVEEAVGKTKEDEIFALTNALGEKIN